MNPLLRILGLALLVLLAALLALLVLPATSREGAAPSAAPSAAPAASAAPVSAPPTPVAAKAAQLRERALLILAALAFVTAVILVFALAGRSLRPESGTEPAANARRELSTLAKLAENTVAQGVELTRERDVRRRAEEDARLRQQLLAESTEEKVRIGRDLHDGIIQSLYAVGLTLESARTLLQRDPAEADRRLESVRVALNTTIRDVRAYITGLAPENLRRTGFAQALETLMLEMQAGRDARFDVKIDEDAANLLSQEQSLQTLQIVREAVSNAFRHGGASSIILRVHRGDREVCVLVQDNGVGFDATKRRPGGLGLGNMHARAERLGATLVIASAPGEGTRVVATLPLLEPSAA